MDSYSKFLADNVLTEGKVATYRLLSRALQVHVNTAKQMLYEFHRSQNAKRPGAVHATYLVYGTRKASNATSEVQNGADVDVEMTSSPPEVESVADVVPTFTLSLAPEERLKETLADYEEVTSIHIYSLAPHPPNGMALLADAANKVTAQDASNDDTKSLAPIANSKMRRRERLGPGAKAAAAAKPGAQLHPKAAVPKILPAQVPAKVKEEPNPAQPVRETAGKTPSAGPAKKPAVPLKRGANSGIMQAFSKAATKPVTAKKQPDASQAATASGEDSSVQAMSDDGEDDEVLPQPKLPIASGVKSRKQREEELRRMMENDDLEEEVLEKEETPAADEPMEEEPPAPEPQKEEETEIVAASTNGRRRGKRKVMRKKQIMDDQGYLVTIQEPGWESFSEDEPPPPTKPKTTGSTPATQAAKPKSGGQKGGQGSIMSFFSKK